MPVLHLSDQYLGVAVSFITHEAFYGPPCPPRSCLAHVALHEGIEAVDMPASFPGEGIEGIEAVVQHLETARWSTSEKVQKSEIANENMCDSAKENM